MLVSRLMDRVGTLRAEGLIQSIPVQPFQAPKAEGAFETCLGRPSSSNIVITFDDTTEEVKVCPYIDGFCGFSPLTLTI